MTKDFFPSHPFKGLFKGLRLGFRGNRFGKALIRVNVLTNIAKHTCLCVYCITLHVYTAGSSCRGGSSGNRGTFRPNNLKLKMELAHVHKIPRQFCSESDEGLLS